VTVLAAICGAGAGLGLTLVLAGWIRGRRDEPRPEVVPQRWERRNGRIALAIGTGVLVGAGTGWPVAALLAAAACWSLPALFIESKANAALIARVEAVAGWAEMLRDTMAGAAGLEQAIEASAPVAPLPIRRHVATLAQRLERERLSVALRQFADEVADPTCDLVVAALLLAAEHQARRLGDLLGTLATAAREQATMRLRVEAGRARTRTSVKVVVGVTLGLALFLAILNRGYLTPYDGALGQLILLLVGSLFALAFGWLARMTRPTQPARLLVGRQAPP